MLSRTTSFQLILIWRPQYQIILAQAAESSGLKKTISDTTSAAYTGAANAAEYVKTVVTSDEVSINFSLLSIFSPCHSLIIHTCSKYVSTLHQNWINTLRAVELQLLTQIIINQYLRPSKRHPILTRPLLQLQKVPTRLWIKLSNRENWR